MKIIWHRREPCDPVHHFATMVTVVDADTAHAEMRLYELQDNVWKIRKYELFPKSDEQ